MVNKKKRNRQNGPEEEHGSDSTESWDDSQGTNGNAFGKCPHVQKSVDLTRVKKSLKTSGIAHECVDCSKSSKSELDEDDTLEDANPGLWLCLRCGHQSCGRERRQHALKHFQTPRSDSHAVVVNTELWNVWCYECDLEVPATCRKKLHECLEFIKRQEDAPIKAKKPASLNIQQHKKELEVANVDEAKSDVIEMNGIMHSPVRSKEICPKDLPRVRGLRNIGNTCFFNAVLQCLGQTPFLLSVLGEVRTPGTPFTLPGGRIPMGDGEEDLVLPPIEGVLGRLSTVGMTESLALILAQLRSTDVGAINPEALLKKLTVRCPQFAGYEQHDSHELLRHLLEGVRAEDLKRYQSAILNKLGLSEKVDPNQVESFLRLQVKHYGRQASDLCLYPDQVFRGFLVSTLECQDCLHASQRVESFLDLSLPVMADKPQPPTVTRRKSNDDPLDFCNKDSQPSKHQQKKERKQARKGKKKGKGRVSESGQGEPTIDEENIAEDNNSGESEQTDADVEDNADQDGLPDKPSHDVSESGYCSEKAATESPADSPVSHSVDGDSVAIALPYGPALAISIPAMCPHSNPESLSPGSSDVNIDMAQPLGEDSSLNPDLERPVSRFQFSPAARGSPEGEESDGGLGRVYNINEARSQDLFKGLAAKIKTSQARVAQCSPSEEGDDHTLPGFSPANINISSQARVAQCSPSEEGEDHTLSCFSPVNINLSPQAPVAQCSPSDDPTVSGFSPANINISSQAQVNQYSLSDDPTLSGFSTANINISSQARVAQCSPSEEGEDLTLSGFSPANINISSQARVAQCSPSEEGEDHTLSGFSPANINISSQARVAQCSPSEEGEDLTLSSFSPANINISSQARVAQCSPSEEGDDHTLSGFSPANINISSQARVAQCSPSEEGDDHTLSGFSPANINISSQARMAHCSPSDDPTLSGFSPANINLSLQAPVAQCSPSEEGEDPTISGIRSQLQSLGLVLRDPGSEVTQDEVESLISKLDVEDGVGELAEGLRKVSLSGSGDAALPPGGPEDLRRRRGGMGDASPSRDSVAWGATMGPKYTTDDGECSIQSCLNQFTAIELMTGNNKVGCENCTKRHNRGKEGKTVNTNATKQFLVSSPPPVLILHLKRFQMNRSVFKKLHRPVSFPLVLDLAPLIAAKTKGQPNGSGQQRQVVYSLYGIVEHSGHMAGGHYVAYVKVRPPLQPEDPRWAFLGREAKAENGESPCEQAAGGCVEPPPGKWYFVSDSQVNEVSEDRVLRSQAYLLFYERIW